MSDGLLAYFDWKDLTLQNGDTLTLSPTIIVPIVDTEGETTPGIKYVENKYMFIIKDFDNIEFFGYAPYNRNLMQDQSVTLDKLLCNAFRENIRGVHNAMTEKEAARLNPGDKICLDGNNWRIVDDVIYDIATVIEPPTKLFKGRLVINYELRFGEASMVSSVYPEGCEIFSRTERSEGPHKCRCDIMVLMSKGCQCNGE